MGVYVHYTVHSRREREPLELTFTVYQVQYLHSIFIHIKLRTWEGSKTRRGKIPRARMIPLLLKCGCLCLSLWLLVGRGFPLVLLPSLVLIYIYVYMYIKYISKTTGHLFIYLYYNIIFIFFIIFTILQY